MLSFVDVYRDIEITYRLVFLPDESLSVEILGENPLITPLSGILVKPGDVIPNESPRERMLAAVSRMMEGFESWLPGFLLKLKAAGMDWTPDRKPLVAEKYLLQMDDEEITTEYRRSLNS